ncbi:MAG: hypothetical protein JST55_16415 [Bacteroidetes bacterium]|nr:hypothetical protein [Bacteroidota bacterium]
MKEKAPFMRAFMKNYIFEQIKVPLSIESIEKKESYEKIIEFCLNTRRRIRNEHLESGKKYFSDNYALFRELLLVKKDVIQLQQLVYKAEGVGQKIGSFILVVFIHYILQDNEMSKQLNVPLDTHVIRIFEEAFNEKPPNVGYKIDAKEYRDFQGKLKENSADGNTIYFDYFWFIGKVFHTKINPGRNNKGYRLCSMCWIKDVCQSNDKWE